MSAIMEAAQALAGPMAAFRQHLHQNPETAFNEQATTDAIRNLLEEAGIRTISLKDTGVVGILEGNTPGDAGCTALRADIDALPVTENTGVSYQSAVPGVMHACGHDGNTAGVAGAALILSKMRDRFSGTVKFIFQPAEESLKGSTTLIEQGVLENPLVDRIFACHAWPALPTGKVGIYPGPYMAMAGKFRLCISAPGAHGAYPHQGVDTVLAAAELIQRLNCIVSREVSALDRAVFSVCTINGGQAFNVVPGEVVLTGTFRCLDEGAVDLLKRAARRVAEGVCRANRCDFDLEFEDLVPVLSNSDAGVASVRQAAETFLPAGCLEDLVSPCMGSEDFARYLAKVPHGAFIRVGVTPEGRGTPVHLHSDRFDYDDKALPYGMALLAGLVMVHHGAGKYALPTTDSSGRR